MQRYDADSGLVYQETIVKGSNRTRDDWHLRHTGQRPKYEAPHDGPPTLQSIALRKVLCNFDDMDANALRDVPQIILEGLWSASKRSYVSVDRTMTALS